MTSHGSPEGFYLRNAPPITPQKLNKILDLYCNERPTVVLISACYSGVFVGPSMQKENRIILTAARQDRTSFGCSTENQYTYWDSCLIDSLPTTQSDPVELADAPKVDDDGACVAKPRRQRPNARRL